MAATNENAAVRPQKEGQNSIAQSYEIQANEFRNVKLATFWRNRSKLWFVAIKSELTAYRVRADDIKYSAVVKHLDEQSMIAVADSNNHRPQVNMKSSRLH